MFDGIISAVCDFFRDILWGIASMFLFILDLIWDMVLRIATLDIGSFSWLKDWYAVMAVTLSMFITFRVIKIVLKNMFDEDYHEKVKPVKMIIMIIVASVVTSLMPIMYSYACSITTDAIDNISYFLPSSSTTSTDMSNIIIQSGRVNIEDTNADLGDEIVYNAAFDINAKDANDDYLYFPSFASLFLVIVLSVMAVFIFTITALQVGQRFYLLILKYLISPYAISGLVDPEDQTFSIWCKMVIGDLLTNFIQIFSVYLILYLCNNSTIKSALGSGVFGLCCQIVFFLAGLSAVQQVPSSIARLVGGSGAGAMQALQDIKTIGSASKAVALGGAGVATTVAGVGMGTAGGILSGMGEGISKTSDDDSRLSKAMTIGGSTLKGGLSGGFGTLGKSAMGAYTGYNQRRQFGSAGWQGGKAGIKSGASSLAKGVGSMINTSSGAGSYDSGNNTDGTWFDDDSSISNKNYHNNSSNYNDSPTDDQLNAAEALGIEGAENMTRGELSKALENAGLNDTWFKPSNSQKPTAQQLTLAEFYGIHGAENMTYDQLNKELKKAGADIPDPSTATKKKENISTGGEKLYQDTLNNRKIK